MIINISYDINYQKEADAISTDLLKRTRAAVLAGSVRITAHAMARLVERGFSLPDVERVLKNGFHDQARGAMVPNGVWRDRIEGKTVDGKTIKLAVEVNGDVTLVTVID